MKGMGVLVLTLAVVMVAAAAELNSGSGQVVAVPQAELKWKNMGVPGLDAAVVSGDMEKGPSRFYLKYPAGFVSPAHHHSADHYATLVSGTITLTAGGKDYRLGPGSYFALTGKLPHIAKVEGKEDAIFFIQADGPWDVVMEK